MSRDAAFERYKALDNSDLLAAGLGGVSRKDWTDEQMQVWSCIVSLATYFGGENTNWLTLLPEIKGEAEQRSKDDLELLRARIFSIVEDAYDYWQKANKGYEERNVGYSEPEPNISVNYIRKDLDQTSDALTGETYHEWSSRKRAQMIRMILDTGVNEGKLERSIGWDPYAKKEARMYTPARIMHPELGETEFEGRPLQWTLLGGTTWILKWWYLEARTSEYQDTWGWVLRRSMGQTRRDVDRGGASTLNEAKAQMVKAVKKYHTENK